MYMFPFVDKEIPDNQTVHKEIEIMYYISDGMYGSLKCLSHNRVMTLKVKKIFGV